MAIKRLVSVDFWTDTKVMNIFSPEDRYFMLYLLTNPHTTQLGIYTFNPRVAAFELGYSQETITVLLERFESKYKIIYWSKETDEIAIRNYLRYSIITGGKPVKDLLMRELKAVQNKQLIASTFANLIDREIENKTIREVIDKFFVDNPQIGRKVSELTNKSTDKSQIALVNNNNNYSLNENENENENEKSWGKSWYESSHESVHESSKGNPIVLWEQTLGPSFSSWLTEQIKDLFDEVGEYAYTKALQKAAKKNIRTFNYVEAVAKGIASGNDYDEKQKSKQKEEINSSERTLEDVLTPEQIEDYKRVQANGGWKPTGVGS